MLLITIALATTALPADQILAGPAFAKLASRTDTICPAVHVRSITPAALDDAQTDFEARLSSRARTRLRSENDSGRRCRHRDGLSCPTTATLAAMDRADLMAAFSSYICTRPPAR